MTAVHPDLFALAGVEPPRGTAPTAVLPSPTA